MRIGVDLDGCVADIMTPILRFYNSRKGSSFRYADLVTHDIWEVFGTTREEAVREVYSFYEQEEFDVVPVIGSACVDLNRLKKGNNLLVVTARPQVYQKKTLQWLEKYFDGVFDEVFFTNQFKLGGEGQTITKGKVCREKGIEIMIEDYDKYAVECAEECKRVLLIDQPWNRHFLESRNIVRVRNWGEILTKVNGTG